MKRILSLLLSIVMVATLFGAIVTSAAHELYYDGAWHPYIGNFFKLEVNKSEGIKLINNDEKARKKEVFLVKELRFNSLKKE